MKSSSSPSLQVMNFHLRAWKLCGLWSSQDDSRLYTGYTYVLWTICFIVFPLLIGMQLFFADSLGEFIEIALILPTAMVGVKGALIIYNRKKLLALFQLMRQLDSFVTIDVHKATVQDEVRGSRFLLLLLSGEYIASMMANILVPLLSAERVLMFGLPRFDPIDYKHSTVGFYCVIGYQIVACSVIAFTSVSMDVYGLALFKIVGAHVDVLGDKLERVGRTGAEGMIETDRTRSNEMELQQCIEYHHLCIQYTDIVNDVLSIHYFVQFGMSGIIICGSEFRLFSIDPTKDFVNYMLVVLYIVGMIFEILMPCYYGSEIKAKSELLPARMFASNWTDQSKRFKSSMLIFGERSLRPITPFAGALLPLALPTFVSTMKFAYSLLAFLKEMEGGE